MLTTLRPNSLLSRFASRAFDYEVCARVGRELLPPPLWGRDGEGGGQSCATSYPTPLARAACEPTPILPGAGSPPQGGVAAVRGAIDLTHGRSGNSAP